MPKLNVKGKEIALYALGQNDYICITDIARCKDSQRTDYIIANWLRNRNTIEFLGIWEHINNPDFKPIEFDGFKKQAGLNSFTLTAKQWIEKMNAVGLISKSGRYGGTFEADLLNVALFGMTAQQWRQSNPGKEGNIRDYANIEQLVVLSNLESINAVLIHQSLGQSQRLQQLNGIAITQMKSLFGKNVLRTLT